MLLSQLRIQFPELPIKNQQTADSRQKTAERLISFCFCRSLMAIAIYCLLFAVCRLSAVYRLLFA